MTTDKLTDTQNKLKRMHDEIGMYDERELIDNLVDLAMDVNRILAFNRAQYNLLKRIHR